MTSRTVKTLRVLLQRERKALTSGDYAGLEGLIGQKAKLLELLSIDPNIPKDILTRLAKNQELLGAAITEMQGVQDRLKDISTTHKSLKSYGQDGRVVGLVFNHNRQLDRRD